MSCDFNFAVLISVYVNDDPVLFDRAMQSIADNTLSPNQVVLTIDGPITDALQVVVDKYSRNSRINLNALYLQQNCGLAEALNHGIKHVSQEWIVRADSDDINRLDRFERIRNFISKNPNVNIVGSNIIEIDYQTNQTCVRAVPESHNMIIRQLLSKNPFNHMTVAYKTECVRSVGGYPKIYLKEDYGLWALLLRENVASNIPEALVLVNAGRIMARKRGGIKYVLSEFQLQKFLIGQIGKSRSTSIIHFIIRSVVFLMPSSIRLQIYMKFLRKSHNIPFDIQEYER